MKLVKRGPYWWVDFRTPSGKRVRTTTGEADEARAYSKAGEIVQAAMVKPADVPKDTRKSLVDALETAYASNWARSKGASSMRRMVNLLQRELVGVRCADVTTKFLRAHCERWLGAGGLKAATVNRRMTAISVALKRAVEDEEPGVKLVPMPHYAESNTKERYVTPAEEALLLDQLARFDQSERTLSRAPEAYGQWRYVSDAVVFLLDSGFRFSELFKFTLTEGCADLTHGITKSAGSNANDGRRVPLTERALAAAERLLASRYHAELAALAAVDPECKKSWEWMSYRFGKACRVAGIEGVTIHILRHTCASRLVQRAVPIYTVSKWLGHSSVKVTERYAKLAPTTFEQALAALSGKPTLIQAQLDTHSLPERQEFPGNGTLETPKLLMNQG